MRGLSQQALARASGVSQTAIASYESGARKNPSKLFELARALDVRAEWLLHGTGPMEEPRANMASHDYALREKNSSPHMRDWPFAPVDERMFYALSPAQRRTVLTTMAALVLSMHDESKRK